MVGLQVNPNATAEELANMIVPRIPEGVAVGLLKGRAKALGMVKGREWLLESIKTDMREVAPTNRKDAVISVVTRYPKFVALLAEYNIPMSEIERIAGELVEN
jgi:hypothetical protein